MINRLRIVSAFDRVRRLINIQNTFESLRSPSSYFASMAHGTATWANKFKWRPVVQLFPRYFIPLSWATGPCQSGT